VAAPASSAARAAPPPPHPPPLPARLNTSGSIGARTAVGGLVTDVTPQYMGQITRTILPAVKGAVQAQLHPKHHADWEEVASNVFSALNKEASKKAKKDKRTMARGRLSAADFAKTIMVQRIKTNYLHPLATNNDKRKHLRCLVDSFTLKEVNQYIFCDDDDDDDDDNVDGTGSGAAAIGGDDGSAAVSVDGTSSHGNRSDDGGGKDSHSSDEDEDYVPPAGDGGSDDSDDSSEDRNNDDDDDGDDDDDDSSYEYEFNYTKVPWITKYKWNEARREEKSGVYSKADWGKINRTWKYDSDTLKHAVTWSMNADNMGYNSYGTHVVNDGDNVPVMLPSNVRIKSKVADYEDYKENCAKENLPCISKKNYYFVLECVGPEGESLLASLDSVYVKCGRQNFEAINTFIKRICHCESNKSKEENLLKLSSTVETHIQYDLRKHLQEDSTCKWHSFRFLFDGKIDTTANTVVEDEHCEACSNIYKLGEMIKETIIQMDEVRNDFTAYSTEDKNSLQAYAATLLDKLETYWTHKVRSVHEDDVLQKLIDRLLPGECLIISDFKMKMQILLYRESMVEFYGKRGFPWLGFMIIRKREADDEGGEGDCIIQFIDCVMDGVKEDGYTVASILEAVLKGYKGDNPHITKATLVTDGAGCFSGVFLFLFLSDLGLLTGISITAHLISEAGCGKSPLDTHYAYCNATTIQHVKEGRGKGDIDDAESCVRALTHRGGIANSIAMVAHIDLTKVTDTKPFTHLSHYMHREYIYSKDEHKTFESVNLHTLSWREANSKQKTSVQVNKLWKNDDHKHPGGLGGSLRLPDATAPRRKYKDMAVSTNDKAKKKRVRQAGYEKKKQRGQAVIAERERKTRQIIENSALYYCPNCEKSYVKRGDLENHRIREHDEDTVLYTDTHRKKNRITETVELVQKNSAAIQQKRRDDQRTRIVVPDTSGSDESAVQYSPLPKSCLKQSSKKSQRSAAQYSFILDIHAIGEANKESKVSAQVARDMMPLQGTQEGEEKFKSIAPDLMKANLDGRASFKLVDCLDVSQIKSYMGKAHSELCRLYTKQKQKEDAMEASPTLLVQQPLVNNTEEEDDDDVEQEVDENAYSHCECNGLYESDSIVVCVTCKKDFHCQCVGVRSEVEFKCNKCNTESNASSNTMDISPTTT
jgi:hypothetical protein